LVLLGNARCGEYLLLYYIFSPKGVGADAASQIVYVVEPPQAGAQDQTPSDGEQQGGTLHDAAADVDTGQQQQGGVIELPAPTCATADLNRDGRVDGLDIQIMVNCLLQQ
jgi:hypothetical protein